MKLKKDEKELDLSLSLFCFPEAVKRFYETKKLTKGLKNQDQKEEDQEQQDEDDLYGEE